jgi:hypothetical protein
MHLISPARPFAVVRISMTAQRIASLLPQGLRGLPPAVHQLALRSLAITVTAVGVAASKQGPLREIDLEAGDEMRDAMSRLFIGNAER